MRILLFALIVSFGSSAQSVQTYVSQSWGNWEIDVDGFDSNLQTYTSGNWGHWEVAIDGDDYDIELYTSGNWEHWEIDGPEGTLHLQTYSSGNYNHWETSSGRHIQTYTSGNFEHWETGSIHLTTYTGNNWEHWQVSTSDLSSYTNLEKAAIVFIPVFTSVWKNVPGVGQYGLGIEETANGSPFFRPNPAAETVTFGNHVTETVRITDAFGKVVLETTASSADISGLAPGTYFISAGRSVPQQLIVQ